jgi:predicted transcriptional regulator of viral defense system
MKINFKNYNEKIIKALKEKNGIITASYCKSNNIPNIYLKRMVDKGTLVKVSRGIYATNETFFDDYYIFQLKYKRCVYSYLSALYLHNLVDRVPITKEVTIFKGYNASQIKENCIFHYVSKKFYSIGMTEITTMFGNPVKTYDKERIICDFIRNRKEIDPEIFVKALNNYIRSKDKKINRLFEYAKTFKIEEKTFELIEVLYG